MEKESATRAWWLDQWALPHDAPAHKRAVPQCSGEGAIYSPEYLARKEGNALGASAEMWLQMYMP